MGRAGADERRAKDIGAGGIRTGGVSHVEARLPHFDDLVCQACHRSLDRHPRIFPPLGPSASKVAWTSQDLNSTALPLPIESFSMLRGIAKAYLLAVDLARFKRLHLTSSPLGLYSIYRKAQS